MNSMQMDTTHSPAQPVSSLARPSADAPAKVKNHPPPAGSLWRSLTFARYLIVLLIGVAATLVWQTYGESATQMIARVVSSPDHQRLTSTSVDLAALRQGIDDLATSIANNQEQIMRSIAMNQERILRNVDQLAAGQEQMAREIAKFQTQDQSGLAPASVSKPAPRPAPKPAALTPAKTP
jgi:TolA-binding protein